MSIDYGKDKKDGGHDHRENKGKDRTPAQKAGDFKRSRDGSSSDNSSSFIDTIKNFFG